MGFFKDVVDVFGNKGDKSSSSSGQSVPHMAELTAGAHAITDDAKSYGKQSAIDDVQGILRFNAQQAAQQVMPSIFQTGRSQGAYNSTTEALLRDNAEAQIIGQLANTQLGAIETYAGIQQNNATALANVARAGTTSYSSSSAKSGGSGILGWFADGGKVPEANEISTILSILKPEEALPSAKSPSVLESALQPVLEAMQYSSAFTRDQAAAASSEGSGGNKTSGGTDSLESAITSLLSSITGDGEGEFADGGKVNHTLPAEVVDLVKNTVKGGDVRTGESDVKAGGKIRGPQTKDGEDNQLIAVGGGEGILAADVMKVPGVEQLVNLLNSTYHKK